MSRDITNHGLKERSLGVLGDRPDDSFYSPINIEYFLKGHFLIKKYYIIRNGLKIYLTKFDQYDTKQLVINKLSLNPLRTSATPLFIPIQDNPYVVKPMVYGIDRVYSNILGGSFYPSEILEDLKKFGRGHKFLKSLFFSIFIDCILLNVGYITSELDGIYKMVLTGGLALKYYSKSHITKDCDIKIYPNDKVLYKLEYVKSYVTNQFDSLLDFLNKNGINLVENYINMLEYNGIITEDMTELIEFIKYFRGGFNKLEFRSEPGEFNPNVFKILLEYQSNVYKLCDISFYEPDNEVSNNLHSEIIEKLYGKDSELIEIPTKKISIQIFNDYTKSEFINYINIPNLNFLKIEKEVLLNDILSGELKYHKPDSLDFYKNKWERNLTTINRILEELDFYEKHVFLNKYLSIIKN